MFGLETSQTYLDNFEYSKMKYLPKCTDCLSEFPLAPENPLGYFVCKESSNCSKWIHSILSQVLSEVDPQL